jgi:hypothetical protein
VFLGNANHSGEYLAMAGRESIRHVLDLPVFHSRGDYNDTDWQFALGTFGAMWEPLRPPKQASFGYSLCRSKLGNDWIDEGTNALTRNQSPQDRICLSVPWPAYAKVWGSKIWRWHSETNRSSEVAHQAGYRLVQSGRLQNFWVIAVHCMVDISTGWPPTTAT